MNLRNNSVRAVLGVSLVCIFGCVESAENPTTAGSASAESGTPATGASGSPAAPLNQPVSCGTATCEVPPEAKGLIKPCCIDEAMSVCGLMSSFTMNECKPPEPEHPVCKGITVAGTTANGCCTAMGKCGIELSIIGMGCLDASMFGGRTTMVGGMTLEAPPPLDCTPEGGAAPMQGDDAGVPASP